MGNEFSFLINKTMYGRRDAIVVVTFPSHQCGLALISDVALCWLSLWVLYSTLRAFHHYIDPTRGRVAF